MEAKTLLDPEVGSHAQSVIDNVSRQQSGLISILMGKQPGNLTFEKRQRSKPTEELVEMLFVALTPRLTDMQQYDAKRLAEHTTESIRKAESRYNDALEAMNKGNADEASRYASKADKHYQSIIKSIFTLIAY